VVSNSLKWCFTVLIILTVTTKLNVSFYPEDGVSTFLQNILPTGIDDFIIQNTKTLNSVTMMVIVLAWCYFQSILHHSITEQKNVITHPYKILQRKSEQMINRPTLHHVAS